MTNLFYFLFAALLCGAFAFLGRFVFSLPVSTQSTVGVALLLLAIYEAFRLGLMSEIRSRSNWSVFDLLQPMTVRALWPALPLGFFCGSAWLDDVGGWIVLLSVVLLFSYVLGQAIGNTHPWFVYSERLGDRYRPWAIVCLSLLSLSLAWLGGWLAPAPLTDLNRYSIVGGLFSFTLVFYTSLTIGAVRGTSCSVSEWEDSLGETAERMLYRESLIVGLLGLGIWAAVIGTTGIWVLLAQSIVFFVLAFMAGWYVSRYGL